jgi:hypothetical protein
MLFEKAAQTTLNQKSSLNPEKNYIEVLKNDSRLKFAVFEIKFNALNRGVHTYTPVHHLTPSTI